MVCVTLMYAMLAASGPSRWTCGLRIVTLLSRLCFNTETEHLRLRIFKPIIADFFDNSFLLFNLSQDEFCMIKSFFYGYVERRIVTLISRLCFYTETEHLFTDFLGYTCGFFFSIFYLNLSRGKFGMIKSFLWLCRILST